MDAQDCVGPEPSGEYQDSLHCLPEDSAYRPGNGEALLNYSAEPVPYSTTGMAYLPLIKHNKSSVLNNCPAGCNNKLTECNHNSIDLQTRFNCAQSIGAAGNFPATTLFAPF